MREQTLRAQVSKVRRARCCPAIKAGNYTGETTLLLDTHWLATARVGKPARLFRLGEEDFWRMLSTCRSVARGIFHTAANKMRNLEGYSLQREKLVSLGTMAAGLAHELNNPAAAARRAAALRDALERLAKVPALDHLERSDRAEAISGWLEAHRVATAWELAPTFVGAGLDSAWLDEFTSKLPAPSHADALGWLEANLNLKSLLLQMEQSTGRIAELVKAVRSYSFMDQAPMQEVDIHEGIENTLTMLGHKLKNVTVIRAFDRSLPRIIAYGSELNQVWTNLIDNAIHAVTALEESALAPAWKMINSSSKSWTTVQAFRPMSSRICSSLSSPPNPSAPAPASAWSSAIASSATVTVAKSNLNHVLAKLVSKSGFLFIAHSLPRHERCSFADKKLNVRAQQPENARGGNQRFRPGTNHLLSIYSG